jgi:hypothetical protein
MKDMGSVSFGEANVSAANVKLAYASGRCQNERADALANQGVLKGMGRA